MRWPPWSSKPPEGDRAGPKRPTPWEDPINVTDWKQYTELQNLVPTVLLTATTLVFVHVYRNYLRRIPKVSEIQPGFFRKRSLFGRVTSVGDGDNFHLFHTPGGRLAGWGWFPGRRVPEKREDLKSRTVRFPIAVLSPKVSIRLTGRLYQIHVRLAGIDAPELAHFGRPAQPFSNDALTWLREYIHRRRVRAYIYRRDQYDRVVATVYVRRGLIRRDVGLQMLKQGLATVYEAKSGAEFGAVEDKYRQAEWWARKKRKGIWAGKSGDFESPRAYKTRMNASDQGK